MTLIRVRTAGAVICFVIACVAGCCASGCQQSPVFNRYVRTSTFDEIRPGVTQADWLTNHFGEPVTKIRYNEHLECWQWIYRAEKHADGWAVLFYSSGVKPDEYPKYGQAWAEIKDGIVVKLNMGDRENDFGGTWTTKDRVVAGNATLRIMR